MLQMVTIHVQVIIFQEVQVNLERLVTDFPTGVFEGALFV